MTYPTLTHLLACSSIVKVSVAHLMLIIVKPSLWPYSKIKLFITRINQPWTDSSSCLLNLFFLFLCRTLRRSLRSSSRAGLECMHWTRLWWRGFLWLGLGLEDGLVWRTLLGKSTPSDFLQSAINARVHRYLRWLLLLIIKHWAATGLCFDLGLGHLLHFLYHTNGGKITSLLLMAPSSLSVLEFSSTFSP